MEEPKPDATGPAVTRFEVSKFTFLDQAKSLWETATKTIRTGQVLASKELYDQRLSICDKCEFRKDWICSVCGCQLHLKASMQHSACPKGFW